MTLPFPKDHELMRPMLETVADGDPRQFKEVIGAEALSTPKRGWIQLAERGRELLAEPGPVTVARLRQFPGGDEAWGTSGASEPADALSGVAADDGESTPEEQIDTGIEQLEAIVRGEQLQRVKAIPPEAFERLLLQLLGAPGLWGGA